MDAIRAPSVGSTATKVAVIPSDVAFHTWFTCARSAMTTAVSFASRASD